MAESNTISISGDNGTTCIGDNITINNHGPCTEKCHVDPVISGTSIGIECYIVFIISYKSIILKDRSFVYLQKREKP